MWGIEWSQNPKAHTSHKLASTRLLCVQSFYFYCGFYLVPLLSFISSFPILPSPSPRLPIPSVPCLFILQLTRNSLSRQFSLFLLHVYVSPSYRLSSVDIILSYLLCLVNYLPIMLFSCILILIYSGCNPHRPVLPRFFSLSQTLVSLMETFLHRQGKNKSGCVIQRHGPVWHCINKT
jgi:hypothetical protein